MSLVSLPAELTLQLQLEVPLLRGVRVELRVKEGRLRTALRAADRRGFDRLRAAAPELEAAFEERGLAADRVVVELWPSR